MTPKTETPKTETPEPVPCPTCHRVGYHGDVQEQGPPWNPWGGKVYPCPRG